MRGSYLVALALVSPGLLAQPLVLDNFESYADDAALQSAWSLDGSGGPLPVFLETVQPANGAKSMRMEYDNSASPFFGRVRSSLGIPMDIRGYWKLRWSWAKAPGSSDDEILVQGTDEANGADAFSLTASTAGILTSYTTGEINLTASGGRYLTALSELTVVARGGNDYSSGTVFFDDFEFVELPPVDAVIEDFESYANNTALTDAWPVRSSGSDGDNATAELITRPDMGQALRLDYNTGAEPYFSQTAIEFETAQDFSGYGSVTVWYQPYFDSAPFANSLEDVEIKLENSNGETIAGIVANQGTQAPFFEYTPLVLDLSGVSPAALSDVRRIALSIKPDDDTGGMYSYGHGTVIFDSITAAIGTNSYLDLNADGSVDNDDILTLFAAPALEPVENFDAFDDDAALNAAIIASTANATATLTEGVGGTKAIAFSGNNGADPFYTQITLDTADFSLDGVDVVTFAVAFAGGSNETFQVALLDELGGVIADADLGSTHTLPTGTPQRVQIATDFTDATVASIRFTLVASDFGNTGVVIDNIARGTSTLSDFNNDAVSDIFDIIDYTREFDAAP